MRVVDSRSNRKILLINKFFDSTINPGLYYLANTIGFCIKKNNLKKQRRNNMNNAIQPNDNLEKFHDAEQMWFWFIYFQQNYWY